MENSIRRISVEEIPQDVKFDGYYWMSDAHLPITIENQNISNEWFTRLPFVIEANFYAHEQEISIQVKNIDGNYYINYFDLSQLKEGFFDKRVYISHDLKFPEFYLVHAWIEESDKLLEGFSTLIPGWSAFAGFKK